MPALPPHKQGERANGRNGAGTRGGVGRVSGVFAAIDLGTNNCRLLVAEPTGREFRVIDGFSRIVGLGEGVSQAGVLSEAAIQRTLAALKVCANKMKKRHVTQSRCVATQAVRVAGNSDAFLKRVRDETGIQMEIISSREEAELTLSGCLSLLDLTQEYTLLFDVGGGSAEVVWAKVSSNDAVNIEGWTSLPCGVVTLTEQHKQQEFSVVEYNALVSEVMNMLRPFDLQFGIAEQISAGSVQMVGTAGTVTTIAGVNMQLPRYNRSRVDGSWLSFDAVERISRNLSSQTFEERARHPCIGHNRADLIVAGCAVLEAFCRLWPAGGLCVADRGVREGILNVMAMQGGASGDGVTAFTPN